MVDWKRKVLTVAIGLDLGSVIDNYIVAIRDFYVMYDIDSPPTVDSGFHGLEVGSLWLDKNLTPEERVSYVADKLLGKVIVVYE